DGEARARPLPGPRADQSTMEPPRVRGSAGRAGRLVLAVRGRAVGRLLVKRAAVAFPGRGQGGYHRVRTPAELSHARQRTVGEGCPGLDDVGRPNDIRRRREAES